MFTFSDKDPAEIVPVTFDFSRGVGAGATVAVDSVSVAVVAGTDNDPSNLLQGAATSDGAVAVQWVKAGMDGTDYKLRCTVVASDGQTLVLAAILPVRIK